MSSLDDHIEPYNLKDDQSEVCFGHSSERRFVRTYRLRDIVEEVRRDYGVNISYEQAYHTREYELTFARGLPKGSYTIARAYGETLKLANPDMIFEVEIKDKKYFKYVFMALGPCIRGFLNCIYAAIVVDGTYLHKKYKGVLLIATYIDDNNYIYPIAFNIVDGENDASWSWFMNHLKASIGDIPNLVIISDRHISIAKAVSSIFLDAFHTPCIYHIRNNFIDKFKNKDIIPHFYLTAKAYRMSKFQMHWAKLHKYPDVKAYLEEVGLQQWARVYQIHCRYDKMTQI
ncbi:uncharacterized protein LOC120090647 [Benincasa hispida]|uniref:uncharacterized protein LOC120090647 n=1 Tax=Benincasa hispida TaxID=102211 RepID=UPI0018FF7BFE|nr:uncharacterized protein LOC120090647 [Benincasa hispida]